MKLGIYLDLRNPISHRRDWTELYRDALDLCVEAEQLGISSVWLSEHHTFPDGYLPQPLSFAAAIAARTSTIRIGTAVLLAPLWTPSRLAEEAASVDILSGGRLDLGLGTGYRRAEYELYGREFAARFATTDAVARELRRLWESDAVIPVPVQDRPPIWMGYNGPKGARRAGVLGEGLLSANPALEAPYREGLAAGGHSPDSARMSGPLTFYVTDGDPDDAWNRVEPYYSYQTDSYAQAAKPGTNTEPARTLSAVASRVPAIDGQFGQVMVDRPEEIAAAIKNYVAEAPVETVFVWLAPGGTPSEMTREHLNVLGTRLVPLLAEI
ncbi:LLM class flavin-dependent oxidoreductase [Glaciibacter sp. 2TAF33]|uniref:LLM class flavin-dependent oxidoreductase n=1 Tax=Glaciibacter sp. 2TAF33 TaxID=3233015 RepID=UPI003F90F601